VMLDDVSGPRTSVVSLDYDNEHEHGAARQGRAVTRV
jgi:hypothetical protein